MESIDLKVFTWLDVAYRALSLAVQDPVIIPHIDVLADEPEMVERIPFDITMIYFYADDEDGENTVRRRIRDYGEDIRQSYKMHQEMFDTFNRIDSSAENENRGEIKGHAESLCEQLIS